MNTMGINLGSSYTQVKSSGANANSVRRMIASDSQSGITQNKHAAVSSQNMISKMKSYSEKLTARRTQAKETSLQKQKLKYRFKDISSKIIRSKTSSSARAVVGQAKREVLRLKRAKQNGDYDDSEEMDAAITHAKAMERIAKKKLKHLQEEEMAKASGGPCMAEEIEEEEKASDTEETSTEEEYAEAEDDYEELPEEYYLESEDLEIDSEELEAIMAEMEDFSAELMSDFEEGMREMLEDMGLEDLSESLEAVKGDMDPADLEAMKSKHRNKEMKEIVKADAEYLKVVFDHLQKESALSFASGTEPVIDISV